MKKIATLLIAFSVVSITDVFSQSIPELLYYKFDNIGSTTMPNLALTPPPGTATAAVMGGQTLNTGGGLCNGTLVGTGLASTTDYVNTNWATNVSGSWTLSFWTSNVPSTTSTYYILGDVNAGGFRVFTGGVAGPNNWILRGTLTDVLAYNGAATGPTMTTFVYDMIANTIYAYVNGVLVNTVAQSSVVVSGTGPFKVGGYSSSACLPSGSYMDEFRFYNRALNLAEITDIYTRISYDTVAITACDSLVSPSGNYVWTSSGNYSDTLTNVNCADSIINIDLVINHASASSISATVCDNYTSPSGNHTWTSSGTYTDTIPNFTGCDSVITVNLTVNQSSGALSNITACGSYTSPSGNYTWTISGSYMDTIPNSTGCDSVISINLTVNNASAAADTITACNSYYSPSGNYTWTQNGDYMDTIPNVSGCDSVISINLTIITNDTSVTQAGNVLTSNQSGGSYVWVDCNNGYTVIAGETNQSFTAVANGSYAVIVTNGNCTADTSACYAVNMFGAPIEADIVANIYPNPTNGRLFIDLGSEYETVTVKLTDVSGKLVQQQAYENVHQFNFDIAPAAGLYFVQVITNAGNSGLIKVVKE